MQSKQVTSTRKRPQTAPTTAIVVKRPKFNRYAGFSTPDYKRPEIKRVDTHTSTTIDSTAFFLLLNSCEQGTDDFERIGNLIRMKKLRIRIWIWQDAPTANRTYNHDWLQFCIFYDRQPNGAAPTRAQIFQDVNAVGTASNTSPWNYPNYVNKDRFKILLNKIVFAPDLTYGAVTTNPTVVGPTSPTQDWYFPGSGKEFVIPLEGLATKYEQQAAGIASIATGSLYFMIFSLNAAADSPWACEANFRMSYTDD